MKDSLGYKIAWGVTILFAILGFFLAEKQVSTYSTSEYWVAKNYRHVYEQYTGEIVDRIEENEKCEIKGDVIKVTKKVRGELACTFGNLILLGCVCTAGLLIYFAVTDSKSK